MGVATHKAGPLSEEQREVLISLLIGSQIGMLGKSHLGLPSLLALERRGLALPKAVKDQEGWALTEKGRTEALAVWMHRETGQRHI